MTRKTAKPPKPPRTVWIVGTSRNLEEMPALPRGVEMWAQNDHKKYGRVGARVMDEHTRWFNLHSRTWMTHRYPKSFDWHMRQSGIRPFYTQAKWYDIPGNKLFPRKQIQQAFATRTGPNRYFTCTVAWCIALAIVEGFKRIELYGFTFGDKPGERYAHQRPCFFYWVNEARARGVVVTYPKEVDALPVIAGDPDAYDGPLYGYETKPEGLSLRELRERGL